MELLLLIVLGFACKSGWDHAKSKLRESRAASLKQVAKTYRKGEIPKHKLKAAARHHDLGWWAGEIGRGFPVTRRGWHAGWLAHRTAADHHRARLEEAKTTHADVQASVLGELPEHRRRQAEARARRDAILEELAGVPVRAKGKGSRQAVREAADEVARKREQKRQAAQTPGEAPPLPADTVAAAGKPAPGPYAAAEAPAPPSAAIVPGSGVISSGTVSDASVKEAEDDLAEAMEAHGRAATSNAMAADLIASGVPVSRRQPAGKPETEADKRFFDLRESGYEGPIDQDGYAVEDESDVSRNPPPIPPSEENPTEGKSPVSADTSYSTVLSRAQAFVAAADQDGAAIDARLNQAIADADAMQGAEVDSATLSEQMDLIDRLQAAKQALAAVGEQATVVSSGVQSRHGGLAEAHQDAPVRAANRDFYAD